MKRLLAVVLLAGVAAVTAWWVPGHPAEPVAPGAAGGLDPSTPLTLQFFRDPSALPAFAVNDLDGHPLSNETIKGKVTIVNFWATWCPPCRAELPDLIALQAQYGDDLQILGISEDDIPADDVKRFTQENGFNYPVAMSTPELAKIFTGVAALPTSFILDREGRIVQRHVGMLGPAYTEAEVRHLAGLPVNVVVQDIDPTDGTKLDLSSADAQFLEIPGVDLSALAPERRGEALDALNSATCTCGCELSVAKCRVDDPTCSVSLPMAQEIVAGMTAKD
jgi:thiol-disulfide isomerase/thioredoxin